MCAQFGSCRLQRHTRWQRSGRLLESQCEQKQGCVHALFDGSSAQQEANGNAECPLGSAPRGATFDGMTGTAATQKKEDRRSAGRAPSFVNTQASVLLDLVRGLAAVFVLLEHWRNILFVDFRDVTAHRMLWAPAYVVCSCGIASVMLFFVLSGYLVGGSAMRMFAQGTWSWREYLLHRGVRLWIVLIPALLLCALFDSIGLHMPFAHSLYHGLSNDHVIFDVSASRSFPTFLANLFFLQKIRLPVSGALIPTFGSAGSLWSLANEFWYYLLFPAILQIFRRGASLVSRVVYAFVVIGIFWFIGGGIGYLFPVWLMGAALTRVRPARLGAYVRWAACLVFLLPFLTFKHWTIGVLSSDLTLGALTTLLLWTMLSAKAPETGRLWERFARWTASFSFTLYLLHIPLCTLLAAWFVREHRFQPGLRAVPVALGILAIVIAAAYGMARVTEYRTNEARLWIARRLLWKSDG